MLNQDACLRAINCKKVVRQIHTFKFYNHRRTGLEIFFFGGGGGHECARLAPSARELLGGPEACSPGKF